MAKRFTRNIRSVENIEKQPKYTNEQNDLLSDDKEVYIRNQGKYEKITGNVEKVNNKEPDDRGNVEIDTGAMTVNDEKPDDSGNVEIDTGVMQVNGKDPDEQGNIDVDSGVKTVTNVAPDENGNVDLQIKDFKEQKKLVRKNQLDEALEGIESGYKNYTDKTIDNYKKEITEQLSHIVTIDFVADCGGVGDAQFNNYLAFIELAKKVNSIGKNVKVIFPPGIYMYKPLLPLEDSWRSLIEIVDGKNIYYSGYGAEIIQEKDDTWTAGYTPSGMREQESPIQFRGTLENTSQNIIVEGLKIIGNRVPFVETQGGDGNTIGLYFRGVNGFIVRDVEVNGWGTDGIVIGRGYGNSHKSSEAFIFNVTCDNNTRQGVSITGADDVVIAYSTFKNTSGGSFGHGIDLEPNAGTQKNVKILHSNFFNNERGALNVIDTLDVIMDGCYVDERNTNGAFYSDSTRELSRNIRVVNSTIITNRAVLYLQGTKVQDFIFENCDMTTVEKPYDNATIRINPQDHENTLDNIGFIKCHFEGTGGILTNMTGAFIFEKNEMYVKRANSHDPDVVQFKINNYSDFKDNKIVIDNTVIAGPKFFVIRKGRINDNEFMSHPDLIIRIRDSRKSNLEVIIGHNVFTEYFYYQGEHVELNVKKEGTIIENTTFGRAVHGGYRRTVSGANAKVGDIATRYDGPTGGGMLYRCTVEGSPGTWETLLNRN